MEFPLPKGLSFTSISIAFLFVAIAWPCPTFALIDHNRADMPTQEVRSNLFNEKSNESPLSVFAIPSFSHGVLTPQMWELRYRSSLVDVITGTGFMAYQGDFSFKEDSSFVRNLSWGEVKLYPFRDIENLKAFRFRTRFDLAPNAQAVLDQCADVSSSDVVFNCFKNRRDLLAFTWGIEGNWFQLLKQEPKPYEWYLGMGITNLSPREHSLLYTPYFSSYAAYDLTGKISMRSGFMLFPEVYTNGLLFVMDALQFRYSF